MAMTRWAIMDCWSWTMKTGCRGSGITALRASKSPVFLADLAEQEGAGIGGEPASQEIGDDGLGVEAGKREAVGGYSLS